MALSPLICAQRMSLGSFTRVCLSSSTGRKDIFEARYSIADLGLTSKVPSSGRADAVESIVDSSQIEHLLRLACIDISYSRASREQISQDLNSILRCCKTLQV